jgi:hypothetical protein
MKSEIIRCWNDANEEGSQFFSSRTNELFDGHPYGYILLDVNRKHLLTFDSYWDVSSFIGN